MEKITIYTKPGCTFCIYAKEIFNKLKVPYKQMILDPSDSDYIMKRNNMFLKYNHNSFPVILINNVFIGGFTELKQLQESGKLYDMLDIYTIDDF